MTHTALDDIEAVTELRELAARMRLYEERAAEQRRTAELCFELTHSKPLCDKYVKLADHYQLSADTLRRRIAESFQ